MMIGCQTLMKQMFGSKDSFLKASTVDPGTARSLLGYK